MSNQKIILVTGGAGFIGSHLCRRLLEDGHRVISLDNYFTGSKDNHVSGVEYREGHTKNIATLVKESPDVIYHLGEYARVEESLKEPDIVWDLNSVGTFAVLEFWRKLKCKLIYAGSSTKFGDGGLARVATPYAWTKAANTELVKNYGAWYALPYAVTYFYNVYGEGERAGKYGTVVEIFRQKYVKKEPLTVVSPGTQKRNFTHVDDIMDGLVLVGEKGLGDEFGLGDEREYSILELAKLFHTDITMLPVRAGNRTGSSIDTSKARALGWSPKKRIETYISEITKYQ
ncbi:MAG TPA: NAD-dependent epimerase/dehydratase family protein [Candidatus Paceibacterota bacterium]